MQSQYFPEAQTSEGLPEIQLLQQEKRFRDFNQ